MGRYLCVLFPCNPIHFSNDFTTMDLSKNLSGLTVNCDGVRAAYFVLLIHIIYCILKG